MRATTQQRLLALLEREHAKLKALNEDDPLKLYTEKEREIQELMRQWNEAKGNVVHRQQLVEQMDAARAERDKHWRAYDKQTKNFEANLKEEFALRRDIDNLRYAFYPPG